MEKLKRVLLTVKEHDKLRENPPDNLLEPVYYIIKDEQKKPMEKVKKQYTLNQIGEMVSSLIGRMDYLESDVKVIKQDIKRIDTRLDYIVKANNLKDLSRK